MLGRYRVASMDMNALGLAIPTKVLVASVFALPSATTVLVILGHPALHVRARRRRSWADSYLLGAWLGPGPLLPWSPASSAGERLPPPSNCGARPV